MNNRGRNNSAKGLTITDSYRSHTIRANVNIQNSIDQLERYIRDFCDPECTPT